MSFAPFVPPPTSARSRALAKEIGKTIDSFQADNPRMRDQEINRALQIARARQGAPQKVIILIMLALGFLVFALVSGMIFADK